MKNIYIINGKRTPFGSFGGSLKDISPIELGVHVTKHALEAAKVDPTWIQEVIFGNVIQSGGGDAYLPRHIGLKSGIPIGASALAVNRLCGSGLEAVIQGALSIAVEQANLIVAGGVENMSQAPMQAIGARFGTRFGNSILEDALTTGLTDSFVNLQMGGTAENLARDYKISREEQDAWAAETQTRAENAKSSGRFSSEIAEIPIRAGKETKDFSEDEFIKGKASAAKLAQLKPAFEKDGTVTAGNASGINDGASAMIVASETAIQEHSLKPIARIVGWAARGCAPDRMGIGPAKAIPAALQMAKLTLDAIGLFEINEAFAAQFLAVQKELSLDKAITNVNGGAIAIGHPLGASGNRVLLSLIHEMQIKNVQYGVASLCIGGGQGIAIVVEKV